MPTKKTETESGSAKSPKKVIKKTTAKKLATSVVTEPRLTTKEVVSEVFKTQEQSATKVEVAPNSVVLYVNGVNKGVIDTVNKTLGAFAIEQASNNHIRTFSLYVDGVKADTGDSAKSMEGYTKIELVSKDSRGL